MHVSARDEEGEDLLRHFGATAAFIGGARAAGGAVLVHCLAGRSRSAAVVCAYMMHASAPAPLAPGPQTPYFFSAHLHFPAPRGGQRAAKSERVPLFWASLLYNAAQLKPLP